MSPTRAIVIPRIDTWRVSLDDTAPSGATTWGVYWNGRKILSGYRSSKDARWAKEYLEAGELPPYVPAMHATPRRFARRKREAAGRRRAGAPFNPRA